MSLSTVVKLIAVTVTAGVFLWAFLVMSPRLTIRLTTPWGAPFDLPVNLAASALVVAVYAARAIKVVREENRIR